MTRHPLAELRHLGLTPQQIDELRDMSRTAEMAVAAFAWIGSGR